MLSPVFWGRIPTLETEDFAQPSQTSVADFSNASLNLTDSGIVPAATLPEGRRVAGLESTITGPTEGRFARTTHPETNAAPAVTSQASLMPLQVPGGDSFLLQSSWAFATWFGLIVVGIISIRALYARLRSDPFSRLH